MAKSMSWWQRAGRPPANPRLPAAWFLADRARGPDPLGTIARLPRGIGVILRDYGAPDRADLARRVAALCRRQRRMLLIAGDARLARAVGADGVHWPEYRLRGPLPVPPHGRWIATAAAHGTAALDRARRHRIDAVLLSPAFATASHPGQAALGPHRLARLAARAGPAVYALGGITARTARRLPGHRLAGIAAIEGFEG